MSTERSFSDVSGSDDDDFLDASYDEFEEQETLAQDLVRSGFFDTGESETQHFPPIPKPMCPIPLEIYWNNYKLEGLPRLYSVVCFPCLNYYKQEVPQVNNFNGFWTNFK
ncbi:unnamed protein product [Peronospora farinosa]|uniref:Uncharacterized protein n=1 Tax=Peronospora farinosa TaxID=134698 RepID=A0AAV0TXB3_9STRA|nr:unnamed protein product [Peronospora farinosa]